MLAASATLFLLTLLGRVLCWHLGASSSPLHTKPWQKVLERAEKLGCVMGTSVAQLSQLMFQKVLNICVLLHGPPFGHFKSSAFQPKPFQIILGSAAPQDWNWKQKSRHPAWDYCRRQNSMAAAPFLCSCTSLLLAFLNYLHINIHWCLSIHIRNSRQNTQKVMEKYNFTERFSWGQHKYNKTPH